MTICKECGSDPDEAELYIGELEGVIEKLRAELKTMANEWQKSMDELSESTAARMALREQLALADKSELKLRDELASVKKDAERYQHWRNAYPKTFAPTEITPEDVDMLTDAAIAAQGEQG